MTDLTTYIHNMEEAVCEEKHRDHVGVGRFPNCNHPDHKLGRFHLIADYEGQIRKLQKEVKEPRYVVECAGAFQLWGVFDTKDSMSVDVELSEKQAYEMAAIRNKWEEISE